MTTVYTVGHGTRSVNELIDILRSAGVQRVADVRRYPGSRRNPQFSASALEETLPGAGIAYGAWSDQLGGRRSAAEHSRHRRWRNAAFRAFADHMDSCEFRDGLVLLERAAADTSVAVMCAETLWWRCHRRLIADTLTLRGHRVVHLIDRDHSSEHVLHEAVRADEQGWPVYDVEP